MKSATIRSTLRSPSCRFDLARGGAIARPASAATPSSASRWSAARGTALRAARRRAILATKSGRTSGPSRPRASSASRSRWCSRSPRYILGRVASADTAPRCRCAPAGSSSVTPCAMQTRARAPVVTAREEAHVVRRDDGHRVRRRGLDGASEILALAGATQALQLDVEAPRQQALPIIDRFGAARAAPGRERLADLAMLAAREAYEPFERRRLEPILEQHAATADRPLHRALREQRAQALESRLVLAQQGQARRLTIFVRVGDPDVGADDRLHAARQRRLVELHERRDVALIRDRARRHVPLGDGVDERVDAQQAIDERIFRVDAQVNEARHRACSAPTSRTGANVARWITHGPNFSSALKCSGVG